MPHVSRLHHRLAVDEELFITDLDRVAGKPDQPLDEVQGGSLGRTEDHDVPASRLSQGEEPPLPARVSTAEDKPVDEQVIAD